MMASFMSYFGGRPDPKKSAREAILTLREQLNMIQKKQEYTQKKIDEDTKKAKFNAVTNKTGAFIPSLTLVVLWAMGWYAQWSAALAALRRKKQNETELERLSGMELQLETQVNTLESAHLNQETVLAIKKAAGALQDMQRKLCVLYIATLRARLGRLTSRYIYM
jgi:charged multivesicular body protein 4